MISLFMGYRVLRLSIALSSICQVGLTFGAGNPIQVENARPGTRTWQLWNLATNHEIEGYASLTSANRGGQIKLFVNTSEAHYSISVYRMGWYGGDGGRLVMGPMTRLGVVQPDPTLDLETGLVECNWINPLFINIPNNTLDPTEWTSGVYLAKLTGSQSGKEGYIIFVVRDDMRHSTYLFQSSVTTYAAYNDWAGKWGTKSLYLSADPAVPATSASDLRARKVSFNRPYGRAYTPQPEYGIGAGQFLTRGDANTALGVPDCGWEYNMVRFLEREGYDVTYCTDIDTHENVNLLSSHEAFLVVGHDEYWSYEMRKHVEVARDSGLNLAFFAANTCYWQIRLEPSPVTGESNRVVVCYKDNAQQEDPLYCSPQTTVQWGQAPLSSPEDSLLGVRFKQYCTGAGGGNVIIGDASNWICAGTGLSNGDVLTGLVGDEWDERYCLGPDCATRVGHSLICGTDNYSDMTVYIAQSGAMVFASGTYAWSWGLDGYFSDPTVGPVQHPSYVSSAAQQMTRNVLGRVGLPKVVVLTSGRGIVAKNPDTLGYAAGSSVALRAIPYPGWAFANWSGGFTGTVNTINVNVRTNTTITANFTSTGDACAVPPSGLANWWRSEEDANDAAGTSHGTLQGGVSFSLGKVGKALSFDGGTGYMDVGTGPGLLGGDVTVACWIKTGASSTYRFIAGTRGLADGSPGWEFTALADGRLEFAAYFGGASSSYRDGTANIRDDQWHYISAVRSGSRISIYVDGQSGNGSGSDCAGSLASSGPLYIGRTPSVNDHPYTRWSGLIDEFEIYRRALSGTEIQAIYSAGGAGKCAGIISPPLAGMAAWWRGEGDGTDVIGANNATLVGGVNFDFGQVGQAFAFAEGDAYLEVPSTPKLWPRADSFTIECWVRTIGSGDIQTILNRAGGNSWYELGILDGGRVFGYLRDSDLGGPGLMAGGQELDGTMAVNDGLFHHVAMVRNIPAGRFRLFVDGIADGDVPLNPGANGIITGVGGNYEQLTVGARLTGSTSIPVANFLGNIDELSYYDRALEGTEIQAIHEIGRGGKASYQPRMLSIQLVGGVPTLTWSAQPGFRYRLQVKGNLQDLTWIDVAGDVMAASTSASKTFGSVASATQKFYRVLIVQ